MYLTAALVVAFFLAVVASVIALARHVPIAAVNHSQADAPEIMSREAVESHEDVPSSLQTDSRQTADRPMIAKPTPEQMLDIFRVLRAAGIKREAISGPWRAAGLPLDTNLWSKAAPPVDERAAVTPIAQRPTNAKFVYDDPELDYRPLET